MPAARLERARQLHGDGRAGRAVVGAHEAGDVLRVVVGADHDVARLAARHACRPRCAGRRAPPRSGRAGSSRRSRRASRRERRAIRPGAGPARPARAAASRPPPESKRSAVGRATRAGAPSASSSPKGRLSVATSATRTRPQQHLHREHGAEELHAKRLWRVDSPHGTAGPQGPAERDRRLLPPSGEAGVAHARRRARDLRGAAAVARRVRPRTSSRACSSCRATARSSPSRASRWAGPSGSTTRASTSTTTCATRRCRSPGSRRAAAPAGRAHLLPAPRPLEAALGGVARPGPRGRQASRSSRRPTTRSWTASSGVDIATVLFDLQPVPPEVDRGGRWTPVARAVGRGAGRRGGQGARAHAGRARRPRARARCSSPGRSLEQAREAAEGLGEIVWAGLNPAPDVPLNVPIGPHRRVRWVQSRLSDFKEIKDALGGTVNDVVLAVVAGALGRWLRTRGVRTEGLELRALVPVSIRAEDERGALGNRIAAMRGPLPVYVEGPGRAPAASCARRCRQPQGVQAGARRRGDRRADGLRAADAARAGLAAQLLDPAVQPDRHERARAAVPALPARPRDARDRARSRSCPRTTRSRSRS